MRMPGPFPASVALLCCTGTIAAQTIWQQISASGGPGRYGFGLAYDSSRDRVVAFGGLTSTGFAADTWEFDGTTWRRATVTGPSPAPRGSPCLEFDATRGSVLLFGGGNPAATAETWRWDGSRWTQLQPPASPPARYYAQIAHDRARGRTVLYGGMSAPAMNLFDTWEWDGTTWKQVQTTHTPSVAFAAGMTYDSRRGRVVLFGGGLPIGGFTDETWEYDGKDWTKAAPNPRPPAVSNPAMTYDVARQRVVVTSGASPTLGLQSDVWEWDGSTWTRRQVPNPPAPRYAPEMVYDLARERCVFFGGTITSGSSGYEPGDTWSYEARWPASYTGYGSGCAGSAGVPELAAADGGRPWLGTTMRLELTRLAPARACILAFGASRTQWSGYVLPFDLTGLGMPGCALLASLDVRYAGIADAAGAASHLLAVPIARDLLGRPFYNQVFGLDPAANAAGVVVSRGVSGIVGER